MMALSAFLYNFIVLINEVLVPLLFAVAFLIFIFGVFRFFIAGGQDKEKREEGRKFIMWGLIGFVIMFSLWGIVNLLVNSLGFDTKTRPNLPLFGDKFMSGFQATGGTSGGGFFQTGNNTYVTGGNVQQPGQSSCNVGNLWFCPRGLDCVAGVCRNVDGS